jgi:alpha-ketoglutarate-dependent taurine dioxygenase
MEITTSTLNGPTLNGKGTLPLVVEPSGTVAPSAHELGALIAGRREWLDGALHRHGGVLFRGFAVQTVDEFEHVARQALPQLKPYVEGQSPRKKVGDNVYTSTEFPAQYSITLHNELSYAKSPPPRIIFHCHIPPTRGGETPIVDCRQVYAAMDPELREKFERRGVSYLKNMHGSGWGLGKSWSEHFETTDRSEVEGYLRENDIEFLWTADDSLKTWSTTRF